MTCTHNVQCASFKDAADAAQGLQDTGATSEGAKAIVKVADVARADAADSVSRELQQLKAEITSSQAQLTAAITASQAQLNARMTVFAVVGLALLLLCIPEEGLVARFLARLVA